MKSLAKHLTLKRTAIAAVALSLALILSATVGTTLAYFTTYATAKGSVEIAFNEDTSIVEEMNRNTKEVQIENAEGSRPVYVRVKAFAGNTYPLSFEGFGWNLASDGYCYYGGSEEDLIILEPGTSTNTLNVGITFPSSAVAGDNFNVIVVYETTPVLYRTVGNQSVPYADWSVILDSGTAAQGGGQ